MNKTKSHYTIVLLLFLYLLYGNTIVGQTYTNDIRLNQLGFFPKAQKQIVVMDDGSTQFDVRVNGSDSVVYHGKLSDPVRWNSSGEDVRIADFTEFDIPGSYWIYVSDIRRSYAFSIDNNIFLDLAEGVIKAYYYNRASIKLEEEYAGEYARPLGHPDNEVLVYYTAASPERPALTMISTPYGWYDAGDYNKYVVNSGISTFSLLSAYETFPELYDTLSLNIPEKDNNIPDILDEALWNIKWMYSMQDPNDGGVYHKTTTQSFQNVVMPADVPSVPRYVVDKGTAATLDFAAIMAIAARIYKPYLPDFSAECLVKAELAWEWAKSNPNKAFTNPGGVSTGEYGDTNFTDEFLWAVSELYITTQNDMYYNAANFRQDFYAPSWQDVKTLALISMTNHRKNLTAVAETTLVSGKLTGLANDILLTAKNHPYNIPEFHFGWGSNSFICNRGMILLCAYELTKDQKYYDMAISTIDYLLGRNAANYSFVTGYGSRSPKHIHHRISEADGIYLPVPGFLVGGPNPENKSDCGSNRYPSYYAAKSYLDNWCSYSTNEVAINYNAPLVFLSGGLQYVYLRDFRGESSYVVSNRSFENLTSDGNIRLYPNPATDMLIVENFNGNLCLYNIEGLKVMERFIDSNQVEIDLSTLNRGIYILVFTNDFGVFSERLIHTK